jgi:hypothetical protein
MRLFSLMANGDESGERRPLSIRQAADRMGISVEDARRCFRHPRAWQMLLRMVDERSRRPRRIAGGGLSRLRMD